MQVGKGNIDFFKKQILQTLHTVDVFYEAHKDNEERENQLDIYKLDINHLV